MSDVIRIFVEKRKNFNTEAKNLLADIKDNLKIESVENLRLATRYDISGVSKEDFEKAKNTIFSNPSSDLVYEETFPADEYSSIFATEYLPGQYDQSADSAAQFLQFISQKERPKVKMAKVIALKGNISKDNLNKIEDYLINPVESRLAKEEKPKTLNMVTENPKHVDIIEGFITWDIGRLKKYHINTGLAMTLYDLEFCQKYFKSTEKRNPTITELKVIDTYWSDHCRHTTFFTKLDNIEIEKGLLSNTIENALKEYLKTRNIVYKGKEAKDVSLMDMATIGMKRIRQKGLLEDLDISDEINACSIEVPVTIDGKKENWLVQFKNETHNHPTEIEPFGGAATCLGGAIRDPLSGRSYVYQAMRITGASDPTVSIASTMDGKLPARTITTKAAEGYSSYGNQIGVPAGHVTELYEEGYIAKRMELGAVVAASPKSNVIRENPVAGDIIILVGGKTGRDGCGGATGSSKAHTEESIETAGAEVQKGNPPIERNIQRLFRDPKVSTLIKKCNDFGAGGVCVAIGELADGLEINLDKVPTKYDGLDGTELAISESQERMAVVIDKSNVDLFIKEAEKENLEATKVAIVTEEPRLKIMWNNNTIVDVSRKFLDTNGVTQNAKVTIEAPNPEENYRTSVPKELKNLSIEKAFTENLSRLEVASQKGLTEMFDSTTGAATVLMPLGGKEQISPQEAMVSKIPTLDKETDDATAMSYGFIPKVSKWSPFHGSAYAVVESLSKLLAVGANPLTARLTFQEYFERLEKDPKRWGKPTAALLGALEAQLNLDIPSIGGKDSMSGSFEDIDVPPTLVSFAITMTKASKTISAEFKKANSKVIYIPVPENKETLMPNWEKLKDMYNFVYNLIEEKKVFSAFVVKEGGVAASIAKGCFGNNLGFEFKNNLNHNELFAPLSGSLVLELKEDIDFENKIEAYELGIVKGDEKITIGDKSINLNLLADKWTSPLEEVFKTKTKETTTTYDTKLFTERNQQGPTIKTAKPTVFIPVFPGTNGEYDGASAFIKAGANVETLIVNNLTPNNIKESLQEIENRINKSQIIMLPGGYSSKDEPNGSGRFTATAFKNPRIANAIKELLENRDGLILGVGSGFQTLVNLGLVPFGSFKEIEENDPTINLNTIGKHVSRMAYTKVVSVKSPWFSSVNTGDVFALPVSCGKGRFVAPDSTIKSLIEKGQVATQYVNLNGEAVEDIKYNITGSMYAIEGLTSPDGRILGKMAHSERIGKDLYKNIPFDNNQKIFESGVKYFK